MVSQSASQHGMQLIFSKTTNDHLLNWKHGQCNWYISELLKQATRQNLLCAGCKSAEATIHCRDCFRKLSWCPACLLMWHQQLPCYWVEKWNGKCFVETTLLTEGFILHVGHGGMAYPAAWTEWDDLGEGVIQGNRSVRSSMTKIQKGRTMMPAHMPKWSPWLLWMGISNTRWHGVVVLNLRQLLCNCSGNTSSPLHRSIPRPHLPLMF